MFSGDSDWNVNNSFQNGFDIHYCYDPQYCKQPAELYTQGSGAKVNDQNPWVLFATQPPPYDGATHTYTYNVDSIPSGRLSLSVQDVEHSDNAGTFTVEIYRR